MGMGHGAHGRQGRAGHRRAGGCSWLHSLYLRLIPWGGGRRGGGRGARNAQRKTIYIYIYIYIYMPVVG